MDIVAALHIEGIDLRQASPGGPTQIDLTGIHFTVVAEAPLPLTIAPHLVVLVRCAPDEDGQGALEVVYRRDGEQVARNVQPLAIEPGKFGYRLVRAELEVAEPATFEAHCRIGAGPATIVPLTVLGGTDG